MLDTTQLTKTKHVQIYSNILEPHEMFHMFQDFPRHVSGHLPTLAAAARIRHWRMRHMRVSRVKPQPALCASRAIYARPFEPSADSWRCQAPANGLWQYMQYEPLMTYPWKILEVFCETNNDWSLVGLQLVWEKDPSRLPIKEGPWHAMAVSKCQTRPGTTPFLDNNTSSWPRLVLRALAGSA